MALDFSKLKSVLTSTLKSDTEELVIVGIDIGSSSIKAVQVHVDKDIAILDTYGELQLGPYGNAEIGRKTNLKRDKQTEAVVDILRESSVTTKIVSLPLPYASSFATPIVLPTKDPKQVVSMVPVEAKKYIPMSLNEVALDWYPVGAQSDEESTKLLLVAIYNSAVQKYQSILVQSGLNSKFTELEMFSAMRSTLDQSDMNIGVIDMGASGARLYIATNGVIDRIHGVQMGGESLTTTISKTLDIPFETAENLKRARGLSSEMESTARKAMARELERGFLEFHRVLLRHKEEEKIEIKKIVLCGGGALLPGIDSFAADRLQCPVSIAQPFAKLAYPAFLEDTLKEAGPVFSIAIGAALRVLTDE